MRLSSRGPAPTAPEPSQTIATGTTWFVNWADTPHIAATDDRALWAHWLQKSAAAAYAYDVALVRSADGGNSWSPPVLVNDDGTATEHGFVSLWPASRDTLGIAWLDGRNTAGGGDPCGPCRPRRRCRRDDAAHGDASTRAAATASASSTRWPATAARPMPR